jgi:hypothetical protein
MMKSAKFIGLCIIPSLLSLSVKAQQKSAQTQLLSSKTIAANAAPTPSPLPSASVDAVCELDEM